MDARQLGDDAWTSVRTLWSEERWLPAGIVLAAVALALWLGATGAAIVFLVGGAGDDAAVAAWLSTTVGTVVGTLLWILGPAAVATLLAVDRVKNVNGNVRHGYRLQHPLFLLAPPWIVLAVGAALLAQLGEASLPILAVLALGGIWLSIRTLAYAYRVFSLSYPILAQFGTFATATALATGAFVVGGIAAGREVAVSGLLTGLAETSGVAAITTVQTDTVTIEGIALSRVAAAVVATPVALSVAYVGIQVAWSVLVRLWRPTVKRPELRTGQRYPPFARPTTRPLPTILQDAAGIPADYRPGSLLARVRPNGLPGVASSGAQADTAATGSGGQGDGGTGDGESGGRGTAPGPRSVYRGGQRERNPAAGSSAEATGTNGGTARSGDSPTGSGETGGSAATGGSGAAGTTDDDSADGDDSAENVGHTRVFTPPDDADLAATARCPACGDPVNANADACPACGAAIDS